MELKSNQFIINLDTIKNEGDSKLEKYAKDEQIDVDSVIRIILSEAERNKIKNVAKVTFQMLEDDNIKIIVEKVENEKKEIVIFPYNKIKCGDKEITLEDFVGKITLYNKEDKNISVTIDGVSLNLFSMTYKKATELLCNISDRRGKNNYLKFEDNIAYKEFGIVVKNKSNSEDIEYIEVYNKEEIQLHYEFVEQKYDVDITKVGTSLEYKVPEFNPAPILEETKKIDEKEKLLEDKLFEKLKKFNKVEEVETKEENEIEIEIPEEKTEKLNVEENTNIIDSQIEELVDLYEKQRQQQQILEDRISKKIEELKQLKQSKKEDKVVEEKVDEVKKEAAPKTIVETEIDNTQEPSDTKTYIIESYKGLKEKGNSYLSLYLGQSKDDIRAYFKTVPKEAKDFEEMELYNNFYAYYDEEDKCTGIGIYNQQENQDEVAVYLFGKNLITMPYKEIVKLIKDHDYKAIEDEDGIISLEYGISIDPKEEKNYKDEICDVIHIFKKGYYDEVYNV